MYIQKNKLHFSGLILLSILVSAHANANEKGEEAFESVCSSCHSGGFGGFISGAPEIGESSDWEGRITNDLDGIALYVFNGNDKHAPMKDEDLDLESVKHALDYILENTQL